MPPLLVNLIQRSFDLGSSPSEFSQQWTRPADVFSVLLILGGDVVGRALAQLAGSRVTPVAFSFGWVAYAVTAVVSAVGENRLMPLPDYTCKVINGKTGYVRDNSSWIIGRILRDFEGWMDEGKKGGPIRKQLDGMIEERWQMDKEAAEKKANELEKPLDLPTKPMQAGLCVSVYKAEKARPGYPGHDLIYFIGFATIIVQLGIAAIPCGLFGDWGILLVTFCGIFLSLATGSLGQWSEEKWACRKKAHKTVILTRGNGSQHAIVIKSDGEGLDLEDLAAGPTNVYASTSKWTRAAIIILAVCWILLLITSAGIKQNTWFLLAIGGIGILQNIYVAGQMRSPGAFGIPLKFEDVIGDIKVMKTLFAVEEKYPRLGKSLLDTFFPGKLRPDEYQKWEELERKATKAEREKQLAELRKKGKLEEANRLEEKMLLEEAAAVRSKEAIELEEATMKAVVARLKSAAVRCHTNTNTLLREP